MYSLSGNVIFKSLSLYWQPVFTSAAFPSLHLIKRIPARGNRRNGGTQKQIRMWTGDMWEEEEKETGVDWTADKQWQKRKKNKWNRRIYLIHHHLLWRLQTKIRFYVSRHTNVRCALREREMVDYIPEKLLSLTCDELKSSFTNSDTL